MLFCCSLVQFFLLYFNFQFHDEKRSSTVNGVLENMWHGDYIKSHPLYSVANDALELLFYYDDFEVVNPIGSKACIHKMGV